MTCSAVQVSSQMLNQTIQPTLGQKIKSVENLTYIWLGSKMDLVISPFLFPYSLYIVLFFFSLFPSESFLKFQGFCTWSLLKFVNQSHKHTLISPLPNNHQPSSPHNPLTTFERHLTPSPANRKKKEIIRREKKGCDRTRARKGEERGRKGTSFLFSFRSQTLAVNRKAREILGEQIQERHRYPFRYG